MVMVKRPLGPANKFVMGKTALFAAATRVDEESSEDLGTETTFSSMISPPINEQEAALKAAPAMTQAKVQARQFRRVKSGAVDVTYALQKVFGKTNFKGKQKEIMENAVKGQDILVVAPTGMGKSLCFQVPAVAEEHGLTLVVTPLISLMSDQVKNLREYGVKCAMLCAQTSKSEVAEIEKDVASGHPRNRLLYITPERLTTSRFQAMLETSYKQRELVRLVVDEAHCIAEHGLSFRPDYQQLGLFRDRFAHVPIMALTASAPPDMRRSIIDSLGMDERYLVTVVHPFNRPNIFYEVRYLSEEEDTPEVRMDDIYHFVDKLYHRAGEKAGDAVDADVRTRPVSGIIYARAKKTCDNVAAYLRRRGINAAAYHKGLTAKELSKAQHQWSNADELAAEGKARVDVIVATIAFGLGIDKPNTRFVIHFDLPKSMEGFYQETGRAGRDGHASRTVLYFSREDAVRITNLVEREFASRSRRAEHVNAPQPSQRGPQSIFSLINYCEDITTCRHVAVCRFFGEKVDRSDAARLCQRFCDVCKDPKRTRLRFAKLSSADMVQTQTQRLVREADAEEIVGPQAGEELEETTAPLDDDAADDSAPADEEVTDPGHPDEEVSDMENRPPSRSERSPDDDARRSSRPIEVESSDDDEPVRPSGRVLGKRKAIPSVSGEDEDEAPTSFGAQDDDDDLPPAWGPSGSLPRPEQPSPKKSKAVEESAYFKKPAAPSRRVRSFVEPAVSMVKGGGLAAMVKRRPLDNFKTPFADPARRHPEAAPTRLAPPSKRSSSPGSATHDKIALVPSDYSKPLPPELRKKAVESLDKHLARATLGLDDGGRRDAADERRIWKAVKLGSAEIGDRRKVVLRAAVEIESDIFWLSTSIQGYRDRFEKRKAAVQSLVDSSAWLDVLPDAEALKRHDVLGRFASSAELLRAGIRS